MMKSRSVSFLVLWVWVFGGGVVFAEDNQKELKVLSYNIWLLAKEIGPIEIDSVARSTLEQRLAVLPELIRDEAPDVITFSEVWGERMRSRMSKMCKDLGYEVTHKTDHPLFTPDVKLAAGAALLGGAAFMAGRKCGQLLEKMPRSRRTLKVAMYGASVSAAGLAGLFLYADQTLTRDLGNGLMVCSKHPIKKTEVFNYSDWTAVEEVGLYRSALKTTVAVEGLGEVEVYSTHLGPRSFRESLGTYEPSHTEANENQTRELVEWIRKTHNSKNPMLVTGDLNFNYQTMADGKWSGESLPAYDLLATDKEGGLDMVDTYRYVHNIDSALEPKGPAYTDGPTNFFHGSWKDEKHKKMSKHPNEVIDYIFVDSGSKLVPMASEIVFKTPMVAKEALPQKYREFLQQQGLAQEISETERARLKQAAGLDKLPVHPSDHFGVMTTFRYTVAQ